MRLSPVVPYNFFNYFCGLTAVTLKEYIMASIGMVPAVVLFVYMGTMLKNIDDIINGKFDKGPWYIVFLVVGGLIGALVVVYVGYLSRKLLLKEL